MFTFAIDPITHDLVFDNQNNIKFVTDDDEVDQSTGLLLNVNTGEWFLNQSFGLDFSKLQVKNPDETSIRAAVFTALQQEPRIKSLSSLSVSLDSKSRQLTVNFNATAVDGSNISNSTAVII